MNTHKERNEDTLETYGRLQELKFLLGWCDSAGIVQFNREGLEKRIAELEPEVLEIPELAPLEPKEEKEYQEYKKAEEKRIYDIEHDYVRPKQPTPPSQIEEEPIRSLVEKWREYNGQQTNEGFDMPVDNSFRGFMEWLEGEVR